MPVLNKLEYLNETKQQIKNALNTNFDTQIGDNDTFRSYVDKIKNIYKNWSKVTGIGTDLTLNNTKNGKMGVIPEGNASQDGEPTPDTPIPIKVVTGEQNIEISGKNLIPTQVNACEQGTIDKGNNSSSTTRIRTIDYYPIKNDVEYHISVENTNYCFLNIWLYDINKKTINEYHKLDRKINGATDLTITVPTSSMPNLAYMRVVLKKSDNTTINVNEIEIIKPQIELGTIRTSFEPYYTPQNYPLSLGNIELAKINDYKDYIFKNVVGSKYYNADLEEDSWYKYNACRKFNITSNLSFSNDTSHKRFSLTITRFNISERQKMKSNRYIRGDSLSAGFFGSNSDGRTIYFHYPTEETNTIALFKDWLDNNNLYILYVLETPTYEKITDTTLITQLENINNNARSYKGTTIIECTSESTDNEVIVANVSALMKGVQ